MITSKLPRCEINSAPRSAANEKLIIRNSPLFLINSYCFSFVSGEIVGEDTINVQEQFVGLMMLVFWRLITEGSAVRVKLMISGIRWSV